MGFVALAGIGLSWALTFQGARPLTRLFAEYTSTEKLETNEHINCRLR
jgi:hypothetical protein